MKREILQNGALEIFPFVLIINGKNDKKPLPPIKISGNPKASGDFSKDSSRLLAAYDFQGKDVGCGRKAQYRAAIIFVVVDIPVVGKFFP